MRKGRPDVLEDLSDEVRDDERSLRVVRMLAVALVGTWAVAMALTSTPPVDSRSRMNRPYTSSPTSA